jgi:plastocyanin
MTPAFRLAKETDMSILRCSLATLIASMVLTACSDPATEAPVANQLVNPTETASLALNSRDAHGGHHVAILDDCDPNDPDWTPTGGCVLRDGVVTEDEFGALLTSSRSLSVVGHPAWRMEPSYLRVSSGTSVRVSNAGGRLHTFTEVAQFGGGFVPPLNIGLTQAPECVPSAPNVNSVPPGQRVELNDLTPGNHRYQCCIHPWMRALIKVG